MNKQQLKEQFLNQLQKFAKELHKYVATQNDEWVVKGFIDVFENIYMVTSDTKIISKLMEIQLFPKFVEFAKEHDYEMVFADKQNWYPDITFISKKDKKIKFAVDLKTTYITKYKEKRPYECNGFTLGSHGTYFTDRSSSKNIQFPYNEYIGHYVLGILYERESVVKIDETRIYKLKDLHKIPSVIKNFIFFVHEKWKIASDRSGSGNTANIGSTKKIDELLKGEGIFWKTFGEKGEEWFDEYWINYGNIKIIDSKTGNLKKVTSLEEFLQFKNGKI